MCPGTTLGSALGLALLAGWLGGIVTLAAGAFAWAADREPQDRQAVAAGARALRAGVAAR